MSDVIWYLSFSDQLISLRIMILVVLFVQLVPSVGESSNSPLCPGTTLEKAQKQTTNNLFFLYQRYSITALYISMIKKRNKLLRPDTCKLLCSQRSGKLILLELP